MTKEERAAEILRIAAIFATGCGNTVVPPSAPGTCEECCDEFLKQVRKVEGELDGPMRVAIVALQDISCKGAPLATTHEIEVMDTASQALADIYNKGGSSVAAIAADIRQERLAGK